MNKTNLHFQLGRNEISIQEADATSYTFVPLWHFFHISLLLKNGSASSREFVLKLLSSAEPFFCLFVAFATWISQNWIIIWISNTSLYGGEYSEVENRMLEIFRV